MFTIAFQLVTWIADLQMRTFYESQGKRTYLVRHALGFDDG